MVENDTGKWHRLASDIEQAVNDAYNQIRNQPDEVVTLQPNPGAWSVKEIVGHLVDSASNNHQRFVRLQIDDGLAFPDYSGNNVDWVDIQRYQEVPFNDLLSLWRHFNLHLARVVRDVDGSCTENIWVMDEDTTFTLGELMVDYLRHLNDHLQQIRERIDDVTI